MCSKEAAEDRKKKTERIREKEERMKYRKGMEVFAWEVAGVESKKCWTQK